VDFKKEKKNVKEKENPSLQHLTNDPQWPSLTQKGRGWNTAKKSYGACPNACTAASRSGTDASTRNTAATTVETVITMRRQSQGGLSEERSCHN
jgi:hypothetical protein